MRTCPHCGEILMTDKQREVFDLVINRGPITAANMGKMLSQRTRASVKESLSQLTRAGLIAHTPGGGNQITPVHYWWVAARSAKGRVCAHPGCTTVLSQYNPMRICAVHWGD